MYIFPINIQNIKPHRARFANDLTSEFVSLSLHAYNKKKKIYNCIL